ncbi:Hypothetical predicted protein [Scomber scombrus]|uniref:Uncharacterized protein n=1 Tax=Scomber scombrus TaxID=13677 RepID=A0AAV1N9V8_SCOSC
MFKILNSDGLVISSLIKKCREQSIISCQSGSPVGPQLVCLGRLANTDVNTLVSPLCKTRPPKANVLIRKRSATDLRKVPTPLLNVPRHDDCQILKQPSLCDIKRVSGRELS